MILRRLTQHVKDQNWFAVGLDFFIVVVGVVIGIQVANWNEARQNQALEEDYLHRLVSDITASIEILEAASEQNTMRNKIVSNFIASMNDPEYPDEQLIDSAKAFVYEGWPVVYFHPKRLTFDELSSSGNLQIIRDDDLRETVTELYNYYDRAGAGNDINRDWLLPNDSRITYDYDVLRWTVRTQHLYPARSIAEDAADLRANRAELVRLAVAAYYWKDTSLDLYAKAVAKSEAVKRRILAELAE